MTRFVWGGSILDATLKGHKTEMKCEREKEREPAIERYLRTESVWSQQHVKGP